MKRFTQHAVMLMAMLMTALMSGDLWAQCASGCTSCKTRCTQPACDKACEAEVGTAKLKVKCFKTECKEYCVPCPSCRGCKTCTDACCGVGNCTCSKKVSWYSWIPGTAEVRNKKVLYMKEKEVEVPAIKWNVVDKPACSSGCNSCSEVLEAPAAPAPSEASSASYKYSRTRSVQPPAVFNIAD